MQRVDLGLASPHGAISLAALERVYKGAGGYATYDGATGEFKEQTREEFGRSLGDDIARAVASSPRPEFQEPLPSPPRAAAPLVVKLKTSAEPHPELLELQRHPVQSLAEIMAQQKAGIGAGIADKPPSGPPATADPRPASRIQTWISPKAQEEENRALRRALEEEKMAEERKAAYHKRRQEQLKDTGAPQCYNCGWFGHISRVCRNEAPGLGAKPTALDRGLHSTPPRAAWADQRDAVDLPGILRAAAAAARSPRAPPAKRQQQRGATLADFLGDI